MSANVHNFWSLVVLFLRLKFALFFHSGNLTAETRKCRPCSVRVVPVAALSAPRCEHDKDCHSRSLSRRCDRDDCARHDDERAKELRDSFDFIFKGIFTIRFAIFFFILVHVRFASVVSLYTTCKSTFPIAFPFFILLKNSALLLLSRRYWP